VSRTASFRSGGVVLVNGIGLIQSEVALLSRKHPKEPRYIGSVEATTCCILFLRHADGEGVACAHVDCQEMIPGLLSTLSSNHFWKGTLVEVSLVGSFKEGEGTRDLVLCILQSLHKLPDPLTLCVAAVLDENPANGEGGLLSSAVIDYWTGEVRRCRFVSLGPHLMERRAQCFIQRETDVLYEPYRQGSWNSAPPLPGPLSPGLSWGLNASLCRAFLEMPDEELLMHTSTSPKHEAPEYPSEMKTVLKFVLPMLTA